jgi:hypothetical protein
MSVFALNPSSNNKYSYCKVSKHSERAELTPETFYELTFIYIWL